MFRAYRHGRRQRGQSLVEFALLVPVLLLLLLGAIDFGRLFLGWVSLQNMARVGANFAAVHADAWPAGSATSASAAADRASYQSLMLASVGATDCPVTTPLPSPSFGLTKNPGDPVRVDLTCQFTVITPLIDAIVGKHVTLSASSNFPITSGCLTDCGTTPAVVPPPLLSNCRTVPPIVGLSVAGARLAWTAAGFTGSFSPPSSSGYETATVRAPISIALAADAESCPSGESFFSSSVTVAPELPAPGPGCVPNLLGVTVAAARASWTDAGFTGSFTPAQDVNIDSKIVILQTTSPPPSSQPCDCVDPTTAVTVSYDNPPPPPPPAPCKVPSFIGTSSTLALGTWTSAGFTGSLTFAQPNKLPYTIQSQTLVGGTYVVCGSSIGVTR